MWTVPQPLRGSRWSRATELSEPLGTRPLGLQSHVLWNQVEYFKILNPLFPCSLTLHTHATLGHCTPPKTTQNKPAECAHAKKKISVFIACWPESIPRGQDEVHYITSILDAHTALFMVAPEQSCRAEVYRSWVTCPRPLSKHLAGQGLNALVSQRPENLPWLACPTAIPYIISKCYKASQFM